MRFLKACFGWLLSRTAISILGIILLALLIWFVAPLIAFAGWEPFAGEDARIVTISLIVLSWVISRLWAFFRSRRTESQISEALLDSKDAPGMAASKEEHEVLRERFRDALKILKDTKLGGRGNRRLLYQLPWYVIIGPPGAGKTTALKNSGLRFPLMDKFGDAAIRGVGGTRNCDWWFTDEAVLLDTAGRYTTQDSDEMVDSSAWRNFLALLKRHRRRCPVNGVLVAIGIDDLSRGDHEKIRQHALAVRKRLQELTEDLKVKVPVYVIFTKCDLIAGFVEFFDDLGREDRGQVWGMTFAATGAGSEDNGPSLQSFPAQFDDLVERLNHRVFDRLGDERDLNRRGVILSFPQQMAAIKGSLNEFLTEAFRPSRYEQPSLLRGVYFSSGTQEGTPIDRAISAMSNLFGLRRQELPAMGGQGRSYFLTRLLREVVFREADLVGRTGFLFRYGVWVQRAAYAGGAVALAGMLALWTTSYLRNDVFIGEVAAQASAYRNLGQTEPRSSDVREVLPHLAALRSLPNGYEDRNESAPILMTFGLYQGDKLGDAARAAYGRGLNSLMLTRLMRRLENQIARSANNFDLLYTTLKTYLMLTDPKNLDPELVTLWFTVDWENQLPGDANAQARGELSAHLAALLEGELRPPPINEQLVQQARAILATRPLVERVYSQIKTSRSARGLEEWRLADKIGAGARVFERRGGGELSTGIPGLFTYDGYTKVFRVKGPELVSTAASERWVIGPAAADDLDEENLAAFTQEVTRVYFDEYARTWSAYLEGIDLVRFGGFGKAIDTTRTLSAESSPIVALLTAVMRETNLSISSGLPTEIGGGSGRLQEMTEQLRELLGSAPETDVPLAINDPADRVTRAFAPLHDLVRSENDQPRPVDRIVGLIAELHFHLNTISASASQAEAAKGLLSGSGSEIIQRLRVEADRNPEPVRRWLQRLAAQSVGVASASVGGRLNQALREQIVDYCRDVLSNRYPLDRGSSNDVAIEDFARFFGPGGRTASFFDQFLAPYVDRSTRPWRARAAGGAQLGISQSTLRQLEAAETIREAFFPGGGARPSVNFRLKPVKLDEAVRQVVLELGEQRLTYRHGPPREAAMSWPPPGGSSVARIVFTPVVEARPAGLTLDGPWALFRLVDQGRLGSGATADKFNLSFTVEGFEAVFELDAESVNNPFRRDLLEGFRCR